VSEYDKGYRAGVMAERRRAMLVALRAVNHYGTPSMEGHSLAHQIGRAGNQIPGPVPEEPELWSVYGERRLVKDLPTHLERLTNPFTAKGMTYIARLEDKYYEGAPPEERELLEDQELKIHIAYLQEQLADAPERIKELEKLVETLSLQLTGVIG
jgi:hypothetical protein